LTEILIINVDENTIIRHGNIDIPLLNMRKKRGKERLPYTQYITIVNYFCCHRVLKLHIVGFPLRRGKGTMN
jgi:hypothetical protein